MAKADHLFVWRSHLGVPFQHHVVDIGDGSVVHFSDGDGGVAGPGRGAASFVIQRTPIAMVTRNGRDTIHVIRHQQPLDPDVVVKRALSQVGRRGYHLIFDNCEHFAAWCVVGRDESRQVDVARERFSAAGVKAMAAGGVRLASRLGVKRAVRGATPWMMIADVAQWATEAAGHHVGLTNPDERRKAGRAVGGMTALGIGAVGGPLGIAVAGGIWTIGEVAGEVSRGVYEKVRGERSASAPTDMP